MPLGRFYRTDLAYIHDRGFGDFARRAGREIFGILKSRGIHSGLVVDLGSGSGIWARMLVDAGYRVHGIDISPAMVDLARKAVPEATFTAGSFFDADLPPCVAITSIGECLNYLFDDRNDHTLLVSLFERVFYALQPGGLFVFDVIEPGYRKATGPPNRCMAGDDWAVLAYIEEDPETEILERRITSFRKTGELYVREEESHLIRLYRGRDLAQDLRRIGFRVSFTRGYGMFKLSRAHAVLSARKP